jgi:hypothetical protein
MRKARFINNKLSSNNKGSKKTHVGYNKSSAKALFSTLRTTTNQTYDIEISKQKMQCSIQKKVFPKDVQASKNCNQITKRLRNEKRQSNRIIKTTEQLYKTLFWNNE